jgi:hypothetical protein
VTASCADGCSPKLETLLLVGTCIMTSTSVCNCFSKWLQVVDCFVHVRSFLLSVTDQWVASDSARRGEWLPGEKVEMFLPGINRVMFVPVKIAEYLCREKLLFFSSWWKKLVVGYCGRICEIELSLKCLAVRPPSLKLTLRS